MPNQALFDQRMDAMSDELREVRAAISEVAKALNKLSVLEERNVVTNQAIEKIAQRQDRLEEKLGAVILDHAKFEANISGISSTMKVMWAAFGTGVIYIGGQVIQHFSQ